MDYTISRGDTLGAIAKKNNTTVEALAKANNIADPNKIYAGSKIKLPGAVSAPVPTDTAATTPPATTPAPTTDVSRYIRTPSAYDTNVEKAQNDLASYYNDGGTPKTLDEIREEKRKQAQASADLVTTQFNNLISQDRVAGDGRNDRVRALNVGAGLGGSDFASTAAIKTEDQNKEIIQARMAERDAKVNSILAGVDDMASTEYQKQRDTKLKELEGNLDLQTKFRDSERTKALDSIKGLAGAGLTIAQLKQSEPETLKTLLKEYGGSEIDLETAWNDSLPDQFKTKYTDEIIEGADGNAQVLRYGLNPITGVMDRKTYDLGTSYNTMKGVKPILAGGRLYKQNPDGSLTPLTDAAVKASDKTKTYKSGSLEYTDADISDAEKTLQASKKVGSEADGKYVDPTVYQQAYNEWVNNGGLAKDFLSKFAPNNYVNPENVDLPQYLRSTKKAVPKTTGRQG